MTERAEVILVESRLDGLTTKSRKTAENEIQLVYSILKKAVESLSDQPTLGRCSLRFLVSPEYSQVVNEVSQEYEEGLQPYADVRRHVVAMAITKFRRNRDDTKATVIVNSRLWDNLEGEALFFRVHTLLHEVCHVLMGIQKLEEKPKAQTFDFYRNFIAEQAYEEYRVDHLTGQLIESFGIFSDGDGRLITAPMMLGDRYSHVAVAMSDDIVDWVDRRVRNYPATQEGLNAIHDEVFSMLQELFVVFAHYLATNDEEKTDDLKENLKRAKGFNAFVEPDWDALVSGFQEPSWDVGVQGIEQVFENTLHRMGIVPKDVPAGLYIGVHEPAVVGESAP